jgi:RNA polymerase primary sigma factor
VNLLARQIKEGNAHARERLISLYMRNVLKIALAMSKQYSFELEDAISAGFVGLIYAVDAYSVEEFTTFHSYASMKISRFIQRECAPSWLEYYVPAHAKVKLLKVFQKYHESRWIEDEIGSSQYNQLIQQFALELNMTSVEIDKCLRIINSQLNRIGVGELTHLIETGFYRENQLVNWNETVTAVDQTELEKSMDSLLSDLSEREARVIRLRYGFGNNTPLTLEEVGNIFGVTRERVRQIEGKAMRKLCHPRNRARIESYLYS